MSDHLTPPSDSNLSRRSVLAAAALAPAAAIVGAQVADAQTSTGAAGGVRPAGAGRAALVTGSSRGIGAAIARRLAQDGFGVTVNCVVNRALAAGVVRDIERAGGRATWLQADVADPRAVRRLFDHHDRTFGGVNVVVSNAGIMRLAPFGQMSDEDFDRMFAVNAKGSFNVLREASRRIRTGGRIFTLSSSITELRSPTYGPYAATKAAQDMYAGVLAKELGERRVSVNAIAPGVVDTTLFTDGKTQQQIQEFVQRTPLGRLGQPEDIARIVSALASGDGAWVSGQTVFANGAIV
jgi:3-oxoacyl-[acyl-carrier protein] reductase